MSDLPTHRQFFGDKERDFRLTPDLIAELERKTSRGIGGLSRSLFAGEFRHAEILETIRLGLIGGGETPEDAAALVATYAAPRPVIEAYALAVEIVELTMLGKSAAPAKRGRK